MKKSLFTIDGIDAIFEGYTQGQRWNGFACPYFTKEVADKLAEIFNKIDDYSEMHYDAENDCFETFHIDADYDETFKGIDIDGLHLYPIGTMCWVWDDVNEPQSEQSKMVMAYLREEYPWLNYEQLYDCYYGICQEINGYMTDKEVKIFADGFMTAYGRNKQ